MLGTGDVSTGVARPDVVGVAMRVCLGVCATLTVLFHVFLHLSDDWYARQYLGALGEAPGYILVVLVSSWVAVLAAVTALFGVWRRRPSTGLLLASAGVCLVTGVGAVLCDRPPSAPSVAEVVRMSLVPMGLWFQLYAVRAWGERQRGRSRRMVVVVPYVLTACGVVAFLGAFVGVSGPVPDTTLPDCASVSDVRAEPCALQGG